MKHIVLTEVLPQEIMENFRIFLSTTDRPREFFPPFNFFDVAPR